MQLVQNSVPFPVPYQTMDDNNTYTKKAQLKVSLNIERFGKIVGAVDIPMPMGGPGGAPKGKGPAPDGEKPAGGPGGPGGAPGGRVVPVARAVRRWSRRPPMEMITGMQGIFAMR